MLSRCLNGSRWWSSGFDGSSGGKGGGSGGFYLTRNNQSIRKYITLKEMVVAGGGTWN